MKHDLRMLPLEACVVPNTMWHPRNVCRTLNSCGPASSLAKLGKIKDQGGDNDLSKVTLQINGSFKASTQEGHTLRTHVQGLVW